MDELLEVEDLVMRFPVHGGVFFREIATVHAVNGVSFSIKSGETLGLVGESGCGKTTVGRTIMRLYDPTSGHIRFEGNDLTKQKGRRLRELRREMQMVFQDPYSSLNARHTIGNIVEEPLKIHRVGTPSERSETARALLSRVGIGQEAIDKFPHEFSGGQRQRIGIARAIATNPRLVICDEPVSALDVSIQSQVLNLLLELQQELKLSYLFIAHDLAVVKHISDRIAVMYLGKIVEISNAKSIYDQAQHPYTQALISAIPTPDPNSRHERIVVGGEVPSPLDPPGGCAFHPRCPFARDVCRRKTPELKTAKGKSEGNDHQVACHFAGEVSF